LNAEQQAAAMPALSLALTLNRPGFTGGSNE
jgi:hypothetical protein